MSELVAPQLTNPNQLRSETILAREDEENMSSNSDINSDEFMDMVDENEDMNNLVQGMEELVIEDDDMETVIQPPSEMYRHIGDHNWEYGINILRSAGRNRMQDIIVSVKYEYNYELALNRKCKRAWVHAILTLYNEPNEPFYNKITAKVSGEIAERNLHDASFDMTDYLLRSPGCWKNTEIINEP
jgi:hypothetical protein